MGSLVSFEEGSEAMRLVIGFGAGKSSISTVSETFVVTPDGLTVLGSRTIDVGNKKRPGIALGLGTFIASSNPAGLILSGTTKIYGELSGASKVQGRAKDTAKEIAKALRSRLKEAGWL